MSEIDYSIDLLEKSIAAIISSIEIYNKPDFKYRNEIFSILLINSWELLLKAKILLDNGNSIESIYVFENKGKVKTNRNGVPLTIEMLGAAKQLKLDTIILKNLTTIIELRDSSMHFYNKVPFGYLIYTLGTANLKNYQKLTKEWFGRDLLEYNFYIMPIGFSHNFQSYTMLDLRKEPEIIQSILTKITEDQKNESKNGYLFCCEINVNLVSAKKITDEVDLSVKVDPKATSVVTVIKNSRIIDRYLYTYSELFRKLKGDIPNLRQNEFNAYIKNKDIKNNTRYSAYNFRSFKKEKIFKKTGKLPTGVNSLYNHDCYRLMLEGIPRLVKARLKKERIRQEELEALEIEQYKGFQREDINTDSNNG